MKLFHLLAERTSFTFAVALVSVLAGQIASLYGYFYFYGYFVIHQDTSLALHVPKTLFNVLIAMLVGVSFIHYVCFGMLRAVGARCELKRLRVINDHMIGFRLQEGLTVETLSKLSEALARFPHWNTLTSAVLGITVVSVLVAVLALLGGSGRFILAGAQAGFVSLIIYLYIAQNISDVLSFSPRSEVKKALHCHGARVQEYPMSSLRAKFASFVVFLLLTLFIMNHLTYTPQRDSVDQLVIVLFTVMSVALCVLLVILYFTSIIRSVEQIRTASEDLASGGPGHLFSGSLDRELVGLNRSMMAAAEEVNRYRTTMESLVREKTRALERSWGKLLENEKRFRSLVEYGSDVISIMDVSGRNRYVSPSCERVVGYTQEELMGMSPFDLVHPDDRAFVLDAFNRGIQNNESLVSIEYRFLHKNGSWLHVETTGKNLLGDPAVAGIVTNSRNITERTLARQALLESKKRYSMILDAVPDLVYELALDGTVIYANKSAMDMLGYPLDALGSITLYDLLVGEDQVNRVFDRIKHLCAGGEPLRNQLYELRCADGRILPVEAHAILFEQKDRPPTILGVARDITERKRAELEIKRHQDHLEEIVDMRTAALQEANAQLQIEIAERRQVEDAVRRLNEELEERVRERTSELEKALQDLKELDTLKDSFLSLVSHELRTPLTSIRSFSEILLNYDDVDETSRREFLGIINSECERLTRLINDVLDLARIEAGGMVWNDTLVSVGEVITTVSKTHHRLLQEKSVRLVLDVAPDLPWVRADKDRILQVVTNLLGNAIKFSFEGKEISIKAESFDGKRVGDASTWIMVSVRDQGVGISEKDTRIIFDKFRQGRADALNDKPKGTGLGLPICKEIVTHYGGNIWVESREGTGSAFFFTLPGVPRQTDHVSLELPMLADRSDMFDQPNG